MKKVNTELMKGSATTVILKTLSQQEMYGYQILKAIEIGSDGAFNFKEGTLYPILHQLEQDGVIESRWEETDSMRKRKYYKITRHGRKVLKEKTREWLEFRSALDKLVASRLVFGE